MGGAPPPRTGLSRGVVAHFVPQRNTLRNFCPTNVRIRTRPINRFPCIWQPILRRRIRFAHALANWLPVVLISVAWRVVAETTRAAARAPAAGPDPAQAIPADAPVYVEAAIRPEGEQGDNVDALLARFLGRARRSPSCSTRQLAEDGRPDLREGHRAVARASARHRGVSTSPPTSRASSPRSRSRTPKRPRRDLRQRGHARPGGKLGDVQTYVSDDDTVGAVAGGLPDRGRGDRGRRPAGARHRWTATAWPTPSASPTRSDDLPDGAPRRALRRPRGRRRRSPRRTRRSTRRQAGARAAPRRRRTPVTAALIAEHGRRASASSARRREGLRPARLAASAARPPSCSPTLPADALRGRRATRTSGRPSRRSIDTFAGALGGAAITGQLEQQTGINLERDVFSWIGDLAVFVRGDTMADLDGAVVIARHRRGRGEGRDPAAVAAAAQAQRRAGQRGERRRAPTRRSPARRSRAPRAARASRYGNDRVVLAFGENGRRGGAVAVGDARRHRPLRARARTRSTASRRRSSSTTAGSCARRSRGHDRRPRLRGGQALPREART